MSETPEDRSRIMRAVKGRDTKPEMIVRRLVHAMGYRYRLHSKDLPGKPDLVFPGRQKIIFVHGCFWHGHACPRGARVPKKNRNYWINKINRNRERDSRHVQELIKLGWLILEIWECELSNRNNLRERLVGFLENS